MVSCCDVREAFIEVRGGHSAPCVCVCGGGGVVGEGGYPSIYRGPSPTPCHHHHHHQPPRGPVRRRRRGWVGLGWRGGGG